MAQISKIQLSGLTYNIVDLTSGYATQEQVTAAITGATQIINTELEKKFGYASYNESNKHIEFKANESGAVLAFIDATDFIKDGMVDNVEVKDGKLVITFNTDSGKEDIEIDISKIFNADNYYDKDAADAKFGTKTEQESLRSDVEDALGEIASLESDLQGKQDKLEGKYATSIGWSYETNNYNHNVVQLKGKDFAGGSESVLGSFKSATINGENVITNGPLPEFELATKEELGAKADKSDTYTKGETDKAISDAIQGAGAITPEEVENKIDTAIDGLKTVGGESLKGGGNIALMSAKVEGDVLIFEFN